MRAMAMSGAQGLQNGGPLFMGPDARSIQDQIAPFMNPYMDQVIGGVRGEFDHLRAGAQTATADAATRAGAFGGSRHGVAEGVRMGELDRAQTSQIGGLLGQGYQNALGQGLQYSEYQRSLNERMLQEPLFRQMQALGMMNMGMGPTGSVSSETTPGPSLMGQLAGAGLTLGGLFMGGAPGAAASMLGGGGGFQIPGTSAAGGLFQPSGGATIPGLGLQPQIGQGTHPWYRGGM
jgi:hypothetical protein